MSNDVLYALDPGTEQSALVGIRDGEILGRMYANADLLAALRSGITPGHLVIEQIECYGMAVGRETFATVQWTGRFIEAWDVRGRPWSLLPRKAVKLALCGSLKAKDTHIRQALLDRYGGKATAIGKKATPGPLYGIKSHLWAALALGVAFQEQGQ